MVLGGNDKIVHGLVQHIQPGAEHALFQQSGQLLAAAELSGLLGIPDAANFIQNEQRRVQMVQQRGGGGVADAVIFVHGLRHQAGIQLGKIGFGGLFQRGAVLAARLFEDAAQRLGGLGGAAEQHLAGGGEVDLFQTAVPALGQQVEGGQRIDLIVPVFHTGGLVHVRRVDVHDIAAHAELSRAVHLTAPHIPGGKQPRHQCFAVIHHAGL